MNTDSDGKRTRCCAATGTGTDLCAAGSAWQAAGGGVPLPGGRPDPVAACLELADIIDIPAIQSLMDDFYRLVAIPMAIIDLQGRVLVGKGWQDVCTLFHRVHPETLGNCLESDLQLTLGIAPGEFKLYKCKNNMWDVATPIIVGGVHLGNLFSGQFFFDDEPLDYEFFRAQAIRYGFDSVAYLAALEAAPRLSREFLASGMGYFIKLTELISRLSYSNLELARTLRERDSLMESLRESEERFRILSDNSPDCVALHDRELRHLYVNPTLRAISGLPEEAFLGKTVRDIGLPSELSSQLEALLQSVLESKGENSGEVRVTAPDGAHYFFWRAVPVPDASGAVTAVLAIASDITERKRSEAVLQSAHDELERRVSERTGELTATVAVLRGEIAERERMRGSLLRLNRLYAVLSETDQAIIRASDRLTLFRDFCRIAVEQGGFFLSWVGLLDGESGRVRRVAACGATGYLDDITISAVKEQPAGTGPTGLSIRTGSYCISNDFQHDPCTGPWHERGRAFGVNASASVAVKEEGRVIGALTLYAGEKDFFDRRHVELVVQMGADISFALDNLVREASRQKMERVLREETLERLRAVEALREKEQLLQQQTRLAAMGEMINNIAHQWRQPLNVLGLLVQQLALVHEMGSFDGEFLGKSVQQSMGLINHMSQTINDFSTFFKPDKVKVEFSVSGVVARTVSLIADSFKNQEIRIECQTHTDPVVFGFANEYSQVVLNILLNARDALLERQPEDPKVVVTIGYEGGRSVVTIADNAGGVPEEIIVKIFEPYFTTKGVDQGTGVGLYMSKTIIEKNMGGSLTVLNDAEGAEFRIEV